MKVGIIVVPRDVAETVAVARAAEAAGAWGLGIADSTGNFGDVYINSAACLQATQRLQVGSTVTNPVTRHWSVHAAALRTLEQVAPGRSFFGIGTGDSAVHTYGLDAGRGADIEDTVRNIRANGAGAVPVHVATSGPGRARTAGRVADDLMLATGMDAEAFAQLRGEAEVGRREAGVSTPLRTWSISVLGVGRTDEEVARLREQLRPVVYASARFAFSETYRCKNVPLELRPALERGFSRYDFAHHGVAREGSPLGSIFADDPAAQRQVDEYLYDRFAIVGTPEECRARLEAWVSQSGVDGAWLSAMVADPVTMLSLCEEVFGDLPDACVGSAVA